MILFKPLSSIIIAISVCFCVEAQILPRAHHAAIQVPALAQLYEVAVNNSDRPDDVPLPHLNFRTHAPQQPLATAESSAAHVKRTLFGSRQTCRAGYGYCASESELSVYLSPPLRGNS